MPVKIVDGPGGKMAVQTLEPVRAQEVYPAIAVSQVKDGVYVVDFGQNIAGVCRIAFQEHESRSDHNHFPYGIP